MFWKLAWRNLWRNRTRTLLSSFVIAFGLSALVFVDGLMEGMTVNMVRNATDTFLGHAQLHRQGFRDELDVKRTIADLDQRIASLEQHPDLERWSKRVLSQGMLASSAGAEPVLVIGVDPKRERDLSKFDEGIRDGNYLESASGNDMLVGSKLAEKLELQLGDRIVLTGIDADTQEMVQELFRLGGIFHMGTREMDEAMVLAPLQTLQKMLLLEEGVHEVAFRFSNLDRDGFPQTPVMLPVDDRKNKLQLWSELMPALNMMKEWSGVSMSIISIILFFIIGLGITNTLLMGLYERMFELGVINSLGTTPWQATRLMFYEAACLGLVSVLFGIVLSILFTSIFATAGIDYTGIEFSGVTFQEKIYPALRWERLVQYPFWTFGFTMVASLYPSWKLFRMMPVEALRKRKF